MDDQIIPMNNGILVEIPSILINTQFDEGFKSITIENPLSNESIDFFITNKAIQITKVEALIRGSSSPTVTFNLVHGSSKNSLTDEVFATDQVITDSNVPLEYTSFSDAVLSQKEILRLITTGLTGIVNGLTVTVHYKFS